MPDPSVYREAFEVSATGQGIVTRAGRVRDLNRAARAALGLRAVRPGESLLPLAADPAALRTALAAASPGGAVVRAALHGADGRLVEARIVALAEDPRTLALELGPSSASGSARPTAEAESDLDRMAALLAHDLRTPIGQIQSAAQLCRAGLEPRTEACGRDLRRPDPEIDILGDRGRFWLDVIESATARMTELVTGLLDRARAGAAGMVREPVDLGAVVEAAGASVAADLRAAGGEIVCTALPRVMGDPLLLRQVFANLVSNAVKYRDPGRPLSIAVSACETAAGVELRVSDNGRGFDAASLPTLFEPFRRGAGVEGIDGAGFGLAACRIVLERHGWAIAAVPGEGQGATLVISVPARDLAGASAEAG